ncbi:hypothetical protein BHE90_017566, partial [Fusarium euwallaceae]
MDLPRDIAVPQVLCSIIEYARTGDDWAPKHKPSGPPPSIPMTGAMPGTPGI